MAVTHYHGKVIPDENLKITNVKKQQFKYLLNQIIQSGCNLNTTDNELFIESNSGIWLRITSDGVVEIGEPAA